MSKANKRLAKLSRKARRKLKGKAPAPVKRFTNFSKEITQW